MKFFTFESLSRMFKVVSSFVVLFLLYLIWTKYIFKNSLLSVFLAIFLSISSIIIINFVLKKRANKQNLKNEKNKNFEMLKLSILLKEKKDQNSYILDCLQGYKVQKFDDHFLICGQNFDIAIFNFLSFGKITCNDLKKIKNTHFSSNTKRVIILTCDYEENCQNLLGVLFPSIECYMLNFLDSYNLVLSKKTEEIKVLQTSKNVQKNKWTELLNAIFEKRRAKSYFFSAVFLLISSFFVYYKIYYLIISSFLLVLCILTIFNFKFKSKFIKDKNILK